VVKGSLFIILLLSVLTALNPIFIVKTGHRGKLIQGLYMVPENAFDVVLLGSSHMNSSINPNELWGQFGIVSYNYGTGGQPLDVTYYLLKEILKRHKNPIVVIDLYYLGLKEEYGQEGYIRYVLDNMRFSLNKLDAIIHCTPPDEWLLYLFPVFRYHNRWKELSQQDFCFDVAKDYYSKGFGAGREVYGKDTASDISVKEKAPLPPKSEKYLYKLIDLSKKEGFPLIFTVAPHDYTSTANMKNWHEEPEKMFNTVAEIAQMNGIPYINYNNLLEEIGFHFKSDMYNAGHMNIWGSNKVTSHLGKFLKENYELADHRNDEKYAQWAMDYERYLQKEASAGIETK